MVDIFKQIFMVDKRRIMDETQIPKKWKLFMSIVKNKGNIG